MTQFRYTAVDTAGQSTTGQCVGVSMDDVHRQLAARGLSDIELHPTEVDAETQAVVRTGADPMELASALANATESGQPLAIGLLALAEESNSRRLRASLRELSQRVAAGEPLDAALENHGGSLPEVLPAVIRAGQRGGRLPLALLRYVDLVRESRELQRSLWMSLIYPFLLLLGCLSILVLLAVIVIPMFASMFEDFDVELPAMTAAVIGISRLVLHHWPLLLVVAATVLISGCIAIKLLVPAAVRSHLLDLVPIIGWMRSNFALARFARMLALLVDGATPFPEALRLAGGTANAGIAAAANRLAREVESGQDPVDAAQFNAAWPRWMVPIFRWHDRGPAFTEALDTAADLCVTRSQDQLSLATLITEPAVIVCIALTLGVVVISLFLPLVKLLNELS